MISFMFCAIKINTAIKKKAIREIGYKDELHKFSHPVI